MLKHSTIVVMIDEKKEGLKTGFHTNKKVKKNSKVYNVFTINVKELTDTELFDAFCITANTAATAIEVMTPETYLEETQDKTIEVVQ